MKIAIVAVLILFGRLGASEITFEAVAEDRKMRLQLQEFFLEAYDAFSAVIKDGGCMWADAEGGSHHMQLDRAKLVCDVSKLTLQVSVAEKLSDSRRDEISKALIAAAWRRYTIRRIAASEVDVEIRTARLKELVKKSELEQDPTRKRILVALINASGPSTGPESGPKPFFGLRRRG